MCSHPPCSDVKKKRCDVISPWIICVFKLRVIVFFPLLICTQLAHNHDINQGSPGERCFSHSHSLHWYIVLWSIMQVRRYIMLLVIATPSDFPSTASTLCSFLSTFVSSSFRLLLPLLISPSAPLRDVALHFFPLLLLLFLFPSHLLLLLVLLFFLLSSTATCLLSPPPPLERSASSFHLPLAFLHNVFLLSSPVTTCICYTHFLHELAWHLLIFLLPHPFDPHYSCVPLAYNMSQPYWVFLHLNPTLACAFWTDPPCLFLFLFLLPL